VISRLSNVTPDLAARLEGQTRERLRVAAGIAAGLAADRPHTLGAAGNLAAALRALGNASSNMPITSRKTSRNA
jgi:hypothetical protein